MSSTAIRHDDFDNLVVSALETLWEAQRVRRAPQNGSGTGPCRAPFCASSLEGERRLGRHYPQLQRKPPVKG